MEQPARLTPEESRQTSRQTLPPKRPEDTETAWADPWQATQQAREVVMGRRITDAINADPDEAERLRAARREVRQGLRYPRAAGS